mgnify:CR=1 FL=1
MNALARAMLHNAAGLALFAAITAGAIGITRILTQDRIEQQETRARYATLKEVIPENRYTNEPGADTFDLPQTDNPAIKTRDEAFFARRNNRITGIILPATAPDGYSGAIDLLVGIDQNGTITGVRVTNHAETPGLGDAIEADKSDWILDFSGRSLDNPPPEGWRVVPNGGELDALSGATITSSAVVRAVYRSLVFFDNNRDYFLKRTVSNAE